MGQQHSKSKKKRQSAGSGHVPAATANHHKDVQPTNYDQNISEQKQPQVTASIKDKKMDNLPLKVVDNQKDWKTMVPTTDGSYVPSETSSGRSSVANSTVDEKAQLNRLSQWSQSPTVHTAAPVPVIVKEKTPTLPPKGHRKSKAPNPRDSALSSKSTDSPKVPRNNILSAKSRESKGSTRSKASDLSTASSSHSSYYERNNNKSAAEKNQDKTLEELGLYRFKIPGDGNCLFRAVASQLRIPQNQFHLLLRKAAAMWMKEHKDELMEQGLLENDDELSATETEGKWPGHAAIVALANLLKVNIAVIQGGEKGEIDIEHIEPAEGHVDDGEEHGSVILCYMFNGHYDAVVDSPDMDNPEFMAWCEKRGEQDFASETLARKLQAEEDAKARRRKDNEYDDFRLARALMEEEKQAAVEARERQAGANGVKLTLLQSRASAHMGINDTVNHYDTIDEAKMGNVKNKADNMSNASSEYEKLTEATTPKKVDVEEEATTPKHPVFGRQRSLSLTPSATGTSLKLSLSPHKGLMRNRSHSLTESKVISKTIQEYTEDDLMKFLKPLSTVQARKKFAYLDLIV